MNQQYQILFKVIAAIGVAAAASGCAVLHHVQVGQIDNRAGTVAVPFDIKVSEVGVDAREISQYARAAGGRAGNAAGDIAAIVALFQQGPRTGKPIYDEHYAEKIVYLIHEKCPSGRVTGLMSIREMRDYPAISGEIVKVTGYCLRDRAEAPVDIEGSVE